MTELVVYLEGKRTKKQEIKILKKSVRAESQLVQIVTFYYDN